MRLSTLCIKRPVFTIVLSLVCVLIGLMCYQQLPLRQLPQINKPVVTIQTSYPGASPSVMESQVTTPIENALAGVNGIDYISSQSNLGQSRVIIHFILGTHINAALNDVRDKVLAIRRQLPKDIDEPVFMKEDMDENPAIILSVSDPNKSPMALTDFVTRYIQPRLQQLDGVGTVYVWGARSYAMRIWLNPLKMAARGVTVPEIESALQQQNLTVTSGQIKAATRDYTVETTSRLSTPAQFGAIVVKDNPVYPIRLSDVAKVEVGPASIESAVRVNGKPAVGMAIMPQTTANPIEISKEVRRALVALRPSLPYGLHVIIINDKSIFIQQSLDSVYHSLLEAILLVLIVIYLFLGSARAAFIPIITIPVCLIAAFAPLYLFGYSINTITLLALVLAIGLVVDDAIVIVENIHRHIEEGATPMQAAKRGTREISFAIVAMTITLAAVYAPIAFLQGVSGDLFKQFAVTLAGAVLISGFVALTLSPMMSARCLTAVGVQTKLAKWLDHYFQRWVIWYQQKLSWILTKRLWIVGVVLLLAGFGVWLYPHLPSELAPKEDEGAILGIITAPVDASFDYTNYYAKQIEKIYQTIPERQAYFMAVGYPGPANAFSVLVLKPWGERKKSQQEISQELNKKFQGITGVRTLAVNPAPLGNRGSNYSLSMALMTSGSYQHLHNLMTLWMDATKKNPKLLNQDNSLELNTSQYNVHIKRKLAADLHVKISDIANTISTLIGGNQIGTFEYDGQDYDVMLQLSNAKLMDIQTLNQVYVNSSTGQQIPLSNLVTITSGVGPVALPHYNRMRAATFSAELAPGYSLGEAVSYLQNLAHQILPEDARIAFKGDAKTYLESKDTMHLAFGLALLFIYLVLSAQFESFLDPLAILLSVPLTIVGALTALDLAHCSLNVYSDIGLVTLIGLIAKHGILITEFANQQLAKGKIPREAVAIAAGLRLRPIIMTTAAMVLGALPLALASGAGAESRKQIGWVIVGGMSVGTFFSLVVVPVAYTYVKEWRLSTKNIIQN